MDRKPKSRSPRMERTRTPGVFKRGNRFVVVWRHRGHQHKSFHRTYVEAREAKGRRQAGDSRPASRMKFDEYRDEWFEVYAGRTAQGVSPRTMLLYRYSLDTHVGDRWEEHRLREIEPVDIRRLYAELRDQGLSTSAMRSARSVLSALFATAAEDGLVQRNPVAGVRIPASLDPDGQLEKRAKALTANELRGLLRALPGHWRLFFKFLTQTGLRISEALGLNWQHVDLGTQPHISVRQQLTGGEMRTLKSRSSRRVLPLSPLIAEELRNQRQAAHGHQSLPVFLTPGGAPINRPNLASRVLKPAGAEAGLTVERADKRVVWVSFHSFRHTCASLLFEKNRNVKQVSEWLGHSDPAFTLRTYIHLLDHGIGDAGFFDGIFDPAPPL